MIFFQIFFNEISVTCGPWTEVSGTKKILAKNFFLPPFSGHFFLFFRFFGGAQWAHFGGGNFLGPPECP